MNIILYDVYYCCDGFLILWLVAMTTSFLIIFVVTMVLSVGNLGDLHGISSEFPNDPCTSDC